MPPPLSARPADAARAILTAGAAVLVLLVVWVAARAVGPATAVGQPRIVVPPPPASAAPSASPSPSVTFSKLARAPSRSPSRSRSSAPSPSPSASQTSAPVARSLTVTVAVPASWQQGYVASVRVRNTGSAERRWTITVTHSNQDDLTLRYTWGVEAGQSGSRLTFTGGPVAPGATVTFGYQVEKRGDGNARPSGCTVVGGRCSVS